MKRYLLAIVNAIQELTEVFRFGMQDIQEHFESLEDMLYINATVSETEHEEALAEEYSDGWNDGYEHAKTIFETRVDVPAMPTYAAEEAYDNGWSDGYDYSQLVNEREAERREAERPLSLEELNDELRDAYWDDLETRLEEEAEDFDYFNVFST
jgi:hypothetical protein